MAGHTLHLEPGRTRDALSKRSLVRSAGPPSSELKLASLARMALRSLFPGVVRWSRNRALQLIRSVLPTVAGGTR